MRETWGQFLAWADAWQAVADFDARERARIERMIAAERRAWTPPRRLIGA